MSFKLLGKTIEVSAGIRNFLKIQEDYNQLASKAEKEFYDDYNKYLDKFFYCSVDCMDLANHYKGNALTDFVKKYAGETRKYLAKYEVYTLSADDIWVSACEDKNNISELQWAFENYFIELSDEMNERGKDDDWFASQMKKKFRSLYFEQFLRNDIFAMGNFVIQYLDENDIIELDFVSKDDAEEANALYENLRDGSIPRDKRTELAISMIELDPRTRRYYEYIFNNIPDSKYEIVAIAKYYRIDLSELIEKDIANTINIANIYSEDVAIKKMEALKVMMAKFGVSQSDTEKKLHSILLDYDIKARTYDGVLYSTRELCKQAQSDDLELKNLCGNVKELDKKSCYDFISQIKNKQCDEKIKLKHITILNDRIAEYDNEYLENLVSNIESCQEDECNKIKTQINDYDASQSLKDSFLSRVEMRIHLIWDAEDFERFTDIYINTQAGNDKQIADNHKLINDTGRTGCKAQFLKALSALNDSNVEVAAKYAMAKEGGFFSSMINMGKKDTYETLTLEGKVIHPAITEKIDELKNEKPKGLFGGIKKSLFGGFGSSKKAEEPVQVSSKPKFCPECGEKLTDNVKFCPNCGKRLD